MDKKLEANLFKMNMEEVSKEIDNSIKDQNINNGNGLRIK